MSSRMADSEHPDAKAVRLPLQFDPAGLQADYAAIGKEEWIAHFNKDYFQGDWSGVALRAVQHSRNSILPVPGARNHEETDLASRCPALGAVLKTLQCPLRSVRVLKLSAGSVIREHVDAELGWEHGEVRLHVPIITNPEVEFYIEDRRITMKEGECWYLDLGRPHRVQNRGTTDRLHLVIDCELNDWLRALIMSGEPEEGIQNNFQAFRELVQWDIGLQRELRAVSEPMAFAAHAVEIGRGRGFDFLGGDVEAELNAARRQWFERWGATGCSSPLPAARSVLPPLEGWVPMHLSWGGGADNGRKPVVTWCYLGAERLNDSFFDQTIGWAMQSPFNLLFQHRTTMEVVLDWAAAKPGIPPTGFIFHLSRCGSTLVSRMLAKVPEHVVVSEPPVVTAILQAGAHGIDEEQRIAWLRGMMSALGQPRTGEEERFFVKFDNANTLDLRLLRQAFPEVPWIFLHRDPVEVVVSHLGNAAPHMLPAMMKELVPGIDRHEALQMPRTEYCVRMLAAICEAALEELKKADGQGLSISYTDLPDVMWSRVAEHFGLQWTEGEMEQMRAVMPFHAKNPSFFFEADGKSKQQRAGADVRELCARLVEPLYAQL